MARFKHLQIILDEYIEEVAQTGIIIRDAEKSGLVTFAASLRNTQKLAKLQANEIAKVLEQKQPFVID